MEGGEPVESFFWSGSPICFSLSVPVACSSFFLLQPYVSRFEISPKDPNELVLELKGR